MTGQAAFDLDIDEAASGPFQMQSWSPEPDGRRAWKPMEEGPAANVWRPRPTALEAAAKCLAWTGLVEIPAMQVVDLGTGEVVWRGSAHYPDAGEPIAPEWDALVRQQAHAELAELAAAEPKEHHA